MDYTTIKIYIYKGQKGVSTKRYKHFLITVLIVLSFIFTAFSVAADVTGGDVIISTPTSTAYGNNGGIIPPTSDPQDVYSNALTINSNVTGSAYGGITNGSGSVYNNTVTINNNGITRNVYGGYYSYIPDSQVNNNIVIISGTVNNNAYGGYVLRGNANSNKVEINGNGTVGGSVYGAYLDSSSNSGMVSSNTVTVDGTIKGMVYGGYSAGTGYVTNNEVEIIGTADGNIYGGYSERGSASENFVSIRGDANASVYGGFANNTSTSNIIKNTVVISGMVNSTVYGGFTYGTGAVSENKIIVENNGTVNSDIYGGYTMAADAAYNTIIIENGGKANGNLYGGLVFTSSSNGSASNNTIVISGNISGNVYGGFTWGNGDVKNNFITIQSTATLTTASLWGSNLSGSVIGTGNTLNVNGFSGSINTMANFEYYNFVLGQLTQDLEFIIIDGAAVNLDDTKIYIGFTAEFMNNNIKVGDEIVVISKITSDEPESMTVDVVPSPFIVYDFTEIFDTQLKLKLNSIRLQSQTKALAEGFAAGLAFLGQAADVRSSIYFVPQSFRFIPFAKMVYGKQYISTGSSVNVKGFSAIAGLALNTNFDNGSQLVVGAFIEGGWGDYDSRHSFSNSSSINGKGDTEYYGGGLLARYAMASGLYGEGTFAAGKTETDFKTRDFTPGTTSKYDYSVPYYSANLTVGQVLSLTDMLKLDIYGKYLWTRQGGDNVTMDGYRFKFKDADSHRVRVGGKLKADVSPMLQPYVGAAYEYEFSGKIKGSLYGMNLGKPSLRGGTGIGELGLVWSPNDTGNLKVDLGVQGYVGKREGVSGGLTVTMSF